MEFNINASRMTNPFAYLERESGSGADGRPKPLQVVIEPLWADRDVKNGSQLIQMGEHLTTEMVTCLVYYDDRIKNSGWLRDLQTNIDYEIQHVRISRRNQSMIVTAKVETV